MKHLKTFEKLDDNDIFDVIYDKNLTKVKELIKNGIDIEKRYFVKNWTPLYYAVHHNCDEIVKELIKSGANVNFQTNNGDTPIITAAYNKNLDIIKMLIDAGSDLNFKNIYDKSALIVAAFYNNFAIIKELIEAEADWNIKDIYNHDFFDYLNKENEEKIMNEYPDKYEIIL